MKILLLLYCVVVVVQFIVYIVSEANGNGFAITPKEIYDCNNCNMIGAWTLFFIFFAINPLYCLYKFLYWIFHFGREK